MSSHIHSSDCKTSLLLNFRIIKSLGDCPVQARPMLAPIRPLRLSRKGKRASTQGPRNLVSRQFDRQYFKWNFIKWWGAVDLTDTQRTLRISLKCWSSENVTNVRIAFSRNQRPTTTLSRQNHPVIFRCRIQKLYRQIWIQNSFSKIFPHLMTQMTGKWSPERICFPAEVNF